MTFRQNITISDIAEKAGVNKATASVVLNGSRSGTRISDATRQRIRLAATELGYRPNSSARSIRTGRFETIALLWSMHPFKSFLPHNLLRGLYDGIYERDLHLMAAMLPDNCDEIGFVPKFLSEWVVDGVIIDFCMDPPKSLVNLMAGHDLPMIWTNLDRDCDCVRPDDVAGGRAMTERLLELGHRRIDYVVHDTHHHSTTSRYLGYQQAMESRGLAPHFVRRVLGVSGWVKYGTKLWRSDERPTALICYDSFTARPLLYSALTAGLQVPGDLSIVTFDDACAEEPATARRITCGLLPEYEMGRAAVEMLAAKIEEPQIPLPSRLLPHDFAEGDTMGAPDERAAEAGGLPRI